MKKLIILFSFCFVSPIVPVENKYFSLSKETRMLLSTTTKQALKTDSNKQIVNTFLMNMQSSQIPHSKKVLEIYNVQEFYTDSKLMNLIEKIKKIIQQNCDWKVAEKVNMMDDKIVFHNRIKNKNYKTECKIFCEIIHRKKIQQKLENEKIYMSDAITEAARIIRYRLSRLLKDSFSL